jgi:hypothetical protein
LLEVLLHGSTYVGGWTAKDIHQAGITAFGLSPKAYALNQLRYDLRKLKGHALLQRDGSRYAYRLTTKGVEVTLLFLFFHKRLCGPSPTAAFIIDQIANIARTAGSKPPTIAPTKPSRKSSISSPPLDPAASSVEPFLSKILRARI